MNVVLDRSGELVRTEYPLSAGGAGVRILLVRTLYLEDMHGYAASAR